MIFLSDFMLLFFGHGSYEDAQPGKFKYLFFVYSDKWAWETKSEYLSTLFSPNKFPRELGKHGAVVESFPEDWEKNYLKIKSLIWTAEVEEIFGNEYLGPGLLVIETELDKFIPHRDNFAIIDFSKASKEEGTALLRDIATIVKNGEDFFNWWSERAHQTDTVFKKLKDAIEAKPGIWGFRMDLKKLFKF